MSAKQLKAIKKALDAVLDNSERSGDVSIVNTALLENLRRAVEDFKDVRGVNCAGPFEIKR